MRTAGIAVFPPPETLDTVTVTAWARPCKHLTDGRTSPRSCASRIRRVAIACLDHTAARPLLPLRAGEQLIINAAMPHNTSRESTPS